MKPRTTRLRRLYAGSARVGVILLGTVLAPLISARKAENVVVAPPVMVSTGGDEPGWETIPELKAAAAAGEPLACFQYAQLLEVGDQVAQDETAAFRFYQQAALKDHPESLFRLAKIYHEGLLTQPENHQLAFEYYERAAYQEVPEATYNVGAMLVSGRGVKRDYVEGLAWLLLAAEQGVDPGAVDQVKQRLKSRPDWIKRAENRLGGLQAEIAAGPDEDRSSLAPEVAKPDRPVVVPYEPALKPGIGPPDPTGFTPQFSKPSIAPPTISIPQPVPAPVVPEPTDSE